MQEKYSYARWFLLLLASLAPSAAQCAVAAETAEDMVRAVVAAMRTNEERLGAVSLKVVSTVMPSPEARDLPETVVLQAGNGGTLQISVAREHATTAADVLLDVGYLEWSMREEDGKLSQMWRRNDDLWMEFSRIGRRLRVTRNVRDFADTEPVDPRQLAATRIGHTVADLVTPDGVTKAERFDDDIVGANSIRIECHDGVALEFGTNANLLPVYRRRVAAGGRVIDELRIKYQPTGRNGGLLLKTASQTFPPPRAEDNDPVITFRGKIMRSVESFELISHEELLRRQIQQKEFIFADPPK